MMKSANAPRMIYTRKDTPLILFEGRMYSPVGETSFNTAVTVTKAKSDGGRARVEVRSALAGHDKSTIEVWRSVKIFRKARG